MPPTAVLDTNVIVKALISETSWAAQVLNAFLEGQFVLATSESILEEVRRILYKPKIRAIIGLSSEEIEEFISLVRGLSLLTADLYEISAVEADPEDNKFLACAIEANAEYVVSEDRKHLLARPHCCLAPPPCCARTFARRHAALSSLGTRLQFG